MVLLLVQSGTVLAQEPKVFKVSDFDLHGPVKNCLVLTDYGKEEFAFNPEGLLTKWETRYNATDYDITYYRYRDGELKERRDERYRDGKFDKQTSLAHFYSIDSVQGRRITETIISYNQEMLDQFQYFYDATGVLQRIIRTNDQGVDETNIERTQYKDEHTITYLLNDIPEKSIREKAMITVEGDTLKTVLEKDFVDGIGVKASEKKWNKEGHLLEEQQFRYNRELNTFEPTVLIAYAYDPDGHVQKITTKADKAVSEKEFVYQFDKEEGGNWVKKITTPENTYVTRKITYYPETLKAPIEN